MTQNKGSNHSTTALGKKQARKIPQTLCPNHKRLPKNQLFLHPTFRLLSSVLVVYTAILSSSLLEILCTPVRSSPVLVISSATNSWPILPPLISLPYMPLLRLIQALPVLYILDQPSPEGSQVTNPSGAPHSKHLNFLF